MGRQPCCEKIGLKKGPWTAEEDRKLVSFITRHGHGCWRAVPKLAGLLRCGKSCRLRWTNYLRPDLKRGFLTDSEEKLIIDLHAVIGNRWSRIAAQLPGRTDNEIKNYWNTRIKKRLRQMGLDPNTHQPLPPSHASTSSMASTEILASNCSSVLSHAGTDNSLGLKIPENFEDEETRFSFNPSLAPSTKALFQKTSPSLKESAFGVEAMQNKNSVAARHHGHRVHPRSPTSVFSHGSTEEECEDSSSLTKSGGGSAGQALENEIESKHWMINVTLQQQVSTLETQNWAPAPHVLKQDTSLWNFATDSCINPQNERQASCNVAAGLSSTDQAIADHYPHYWIDIPVEEAISQPYYELGAAVADGEPAGNSNQVPWLQLSDAWATCQELQRLAAILDDI